MEITRYRLPHYRLNGRDQKNTTDFLGFGRMASIDGTNNNDVLDGTIENDEIYGLAGDDTLNGLDGDDSLAGSARTR